MANFRNYPNSKSPPTGKGGRKGPCLRFGCVDLRRRDFSVPRGEALGSDAAQKWKSQGIGTSKGALSAENGLPIMNEEVGNEPSSASPAPYVGCIPVTEGGAPDVEYDNQGGADAWRSLYYTDCEYPMMVCTTANTYRIDAQKLTGHDPSDQSPSMLLDSGASISADGGNRLRRRNPNHGHLKKGEMNSRFGNWPGGHIQGGFIPRITSPPTIKNKSANHLLQLAIRVVKEDVPFRTSRDSLTRLSASISFRDSALRIQRGIRIAPTRTPSGHLMLPGCRGWIEPKKTAPNIGIYAEALGVPATSLAKENLRKIHLHLRH